MVNNKILVEVSARHVHLSEEDFKKLFGGKAKLSVLRRLSQPGEFAAKETVSIENKNRKIEDVRIVGPFRERTQVEISMTDSDYLKKKVPIKLSGDLRGSPGIKIIGPKDSVVVKQGLIVAKRHLHLDIKSAKHFNLKDGENIDIQVGDKRLLTFHDVIVRINEHYKPAFHIDIDEGNAAGIDKNSYGVILKNK